MKKKVFAGVATVAVVAGISGGAYAVVTQDRRALEAEYDAYVKSYSQVEGRLKDLAPINEGCVVDMNDEKLNPLCEDLDTAIKGVPEKVMVDVDKADTDKAHVEVVKASKALDIATANVDKAYGAAEPKLEQAREVFVAEVDKVIKETKTFIKDAQVIIDAGKEVKVDTSELETAKTKAEKTVEQLEGDRDTMRRSTHAETVGALKKDKELVDTLTAATLVVVADKDEKVAEKAVATIGDSGRVSVDKAAEKVVAAQSSGKLNTSSGVGASAVVTPKAVATQQVAATQQAQAASNSGLPPVIYGSDGSWSYGKNPVNNSGVTADFGGNTFNNAYYVPPSADGSKSSGWFSGADLEGAEYICMGEGADALGGGSIVGTCN